MRVKVSQDMKYFCTSETVAHYLQKFIQYRKRKVFVGERSIQDLSSALQKHKTTTRFLVPCSNLGKEDVIDYLKQKEVNFESAVMYKSVSSDLSDLRDIFYDMLIFFSPQGIESLFENFPDFQQNNTRIAVFGNITAKAAEEHHLNIDVVAPAPGIPSSTEISDPFRTFITAFLCSAVKTTGCFGFSRSRPVFLLTKSIASLLISLTFAPIFSEKDR